MKFQGGNITLTVGSKELNLLVECEVCTEEAECNLGCETVTVNLFVILILFDVDRIPSDEKGNSYRLLLAAVSCANIWQNCRNQSKNNNGTQYITIVKALFVVVCLYFS